MEYGKDLLAALAVILNCLPSAMLALSMGFSVLATAIGFAVGAFGLAASGQVAVFSFQPETLLLLSRLSEDRNERLTITVCSSAFVFLLGVTGILGRIVTFIGDGAIYSLLAGMGVMVCKVAVDMLGDDKKTGLASIASAVAMYWLTADLVYTVAVSCIVSVVLFRFVFKGGHADAPTHAALKLLLLRPRFNVRVVKGVFSLAAMQLASIIAYSTVNNDLAGISGGLDSVSAILGVSGLVSGMMSGSPPCAGHQRHGKRAPSGAVRRDVYVAHSSNAFVSCSAEDFPVYSEAGGLRLPVCTWRAGDFSEQCQGGCGAVRAGRWAVHLCVGICRSVFGHYSGNTFISACRAFVKGA